MSISALIQNPKSEEEKLFNAPVASENSFELKWMPVIDELGLRWLPLFSTGIDVEKVDLREVIDELNRFKSRYIEKFGDDEIVDRVNFLSDSLKNVFSRGDVKVFIG